MPKELTTEVVRGCLYTWMLIGRLDGRTPLEITLIISHMLTCVQTVCEGERAGEIEYVLSVHNKT